jgi:hypothetical protein
MQNTGKAKVVVLILICAGAQENSLGVKGASIRIKAP